MASDQSKKPQLERQTHVIELTSGIQTDQFAESVPILDSNNTEVLPGKSGMFNRRGHVRWTKYAPKTDPIGRIALVVDSQPPNLSDGTWLISAVDTSVPTNPIVYLQPFKPRTNLPGDTLVSRISWVLAAYTADYGDTVELTIERVGAIDRAVTVNWETYDGNAEAGTDYTAASGTVTFLAGELRKVVEVVTIDASQSYDGHFYARIKEPSTGGEIDDPSVTSVSMTGVIVGVPYHPVISRNTCIDDDPSPLTGMYFVDLDAAGASTRFKFHYLALPVTGLEQANALGITPPVFVDEGTIAIAVGMDGVQDTVSVLFYNVAGMQAAGAAYSDVLAVDRATAHKDSPFKVVTFNVPDGEFIDNVGPHLTIAPNGNVWYVGRSVLAKLDGTTRNWVKTVTIADIPTVGSAGNDTSRYIGTNDTGTSGGHSYSFWESTSAHIWQWRLDDTEQTAFFCKIDVEDGSLDTVLTDPLGAGGFSGYEQTITARMDSGEFVTHNAVGTYATVDGVTTEISGATVSLAWEFFTNTGSNKVLYATSSEGWYATFGTLAVDAMPTESWFYASEALSTLRGPTWLDATKAIVLGNGTYSVLLLADGSLVETGDLVDAFDAVTKDEKVDTPPTQAVVADCVGIQKSFWGVTG